MTVRMDAGIKAQFEELCSQFGMSVNTAMNIFANAVVRKRKIPFEIALDTPNDETVAAMSEANEIFSGKRKTKSHKNAKAMIKDILGE